MGSIRRFLDFLAKMGLSVRDDPPKVVDVAGRVWSEPVDGFALSVCAVQSDDTQAVPALSVALRNVGAATVSLEIPQWMAFYRIEIAGVPLTPYGRAMIESQRNAGRQSVALAAGGVSETQIPIGALYALRRGVSARVTITCEPRGAPLSAALTL